MKQVGDKNNSAPVERKVTRIITPGTLIDDALLKPQHNFVMAIEQPSKRKPFNLAWMDLTSGRMHCYECLNDDDLETQLAHIKPAEILLPEKHVAIKKQFQHANLLANWWFNAQQNYELICQQLQVSNLDAFGIKTAQQSLSGVIGAVLRYCQHTQKDSRQFIHSIEVELPQHRFNMDATSLKNLEIENSISGNSRHTLLSCIDLSQGPMGARQIQHWLAQPTTHRATLESRLDAVAVLKDCSQLSAIRSILSRLGDLQRAIGRLNLNMDKPRDIWVIFHCLHHAEELNSLLQHCSESTWLEPLNLDKLKPLREQLAAALSDNPPALEKSGGVIREGYDAQLDEYRNLQQNAQAAVAKVQKEQSDLLDYAVKVGHNRLYGFYIELGKGFKGAVPDHYQRRQTLKNAERYVIEELTELEQKMAEADELSLSLELHLYQQLKQCIGSMHSDLLQLANRLASIDALSSFATIANHRQWQRPKLIDDQCIDIKNGRHPIVEAQLAEGKFIPNNFISHAEQPFALVTGPNMGGKSTFMRQNALIVLLAHIGSFVPAQEAIIGSVDGIYTRIGAQDDLASGRSTFMVEMTETAYILRHASTRSLVLMDEIGRGTSTHDGLALARATATQLIQLGCYCLFSTHYFELTDLSIKHTEVVNLHPRSVRYEGKITFLHQMVRGAASQSYGIEVARLAGLPKDVIELAVEFLQQLQNQPLNQPSLFNDTGQVNIDDNSDDSDNLNTPNKTLKTLTNDTINTEHYQQTLAQLHAIQELFTNQHPDNLSPKQAHDLLCQLMPLLNSAS